MFRSRRVIICIFDGHGGQTTREPIIQMWESAYGPLVAAEDADCHMTAAYAAYGSAGYEESAS